MAAVELDYYACDLATGVVVEELLSLSTSGGLARQLGASVTVSADLAIDGVPPDWVYATEPGRSMVVAVDRLTQQPIWPGIVLTRDRGSAPTATLGLATPEAYLDRRYTGTYDASAGADQVAIMTGISSSVLVNGPPIIVDAPLLGVSGTYSVADTDDRSVLSVLQELQGMEGWPEWTIDVQWADAQRSAVQLVLRIRQQIGVVRPDPEPVFDFPGCVTSYNQTESYETGKGATVVQAFGEGEGVDRVGSDLYTAADLIAQGWPQWVYRYTPGTNLTDPAALNAAASLTLSEQRTGSSAWTVNAAASAAPRLGADWNLGDSIRLEVASDGISPGHPDGVEVVARNYGWTLTASSDTVTPILIQDGA